MTPPKTNEAAVEVGEQKAWTVWDAEARMAREGDWRGVAYSISHDIMPLIPEGSGDHAYQERARMQIKAADRLCAALAAMHPEPAIGIEQQDLAGWRLVPVEPTPEMIKAGDHVAWDHGNAMPAIRAIPRAWSAMLAACPTPPVEVKS